jgi:hypothetical protein
MFVARSIARQPDAVAALGAGSKSEKSCSPGSCECASCNDAQPKAGSLAQAPVDGAGNALFAVDESASVGLATFADDTAAAAPAIAELNPAPTPLSVLPYPSNAPTRQPETGPHLVHTAVPTSQGQTADSPDGQTAAGSTKADGGKQAQAVRADTVRSETMIVSIATAMHQRVSGLFGALRARISGLFAQSSAAVLQFIANQQAQISAAVHQISASLHALVAGALSAAAAAANGVRQTIESIVQRAVASLQAQVQGISDQILRVMDRFPLSDLPGISQLRAAATSVVRRATAAAAAGLNLVNGLISSALTAAMTVIQTIIGVARRAADAVVSYAASVVQRVVQIALQMLSRIAAFIASALQTTFNSTILPVLQRLEAMIHQAIGTAQQHAIAALRSNRNESLTSLGDSGESDDEGSDELIQEALDINREIVRTFQEKSSTLIGSVVQRVTSAASQIIARINQAIAMARQLIANVAVQAVQALRNIVQAVTGFIQSLIQGFMSAVTKVVGYVRALIQSPIDQLLQFCRGILNRMIGFIARIVRNIASAVTGSTPTEATGFFAPSPTLVPSPAYAPTPLPVLIAILAFIIALLGGTVYLVGGTIIIIIGGTVIYISVTTAIIILVVVGLLLLLVLIYVTYRIIKRRRRRRRPARIIHLTKQKGPLSRTRTTIGVGEEVFLEYTQGSTTWATTGGKLSSTVGSKVRLDAPETAGTITVTAGTASVSFAVLAPSQIFMDRRGGMKHTKNFPDSGIRVRPHLLPDTVNFYRVIYHEMDVAFTTTGGSYSCNPGKKGHCGKGGGGVPCDDLLVSNKVVAGKGTETLRDDCAYSGHCGPGVPLAAATLTGNIPHEYKIVGGSAFHPFLPVLQQHTLAADLSTLATTKASASGTIKVTDNSSSNGC